MLGLQGFRGKGGSVTTMIKAAANIGCEPIYVSDDMPRDELLNAMYEFAAECDAQMGDWFPGAEKITVRAWPNDRFRVSEMVQIVHKRQHYSAELVAQLIAEDAARR